MFVGKIDSGRLTTYLKKISSSIDDYRGFEIYNIPIEGRIVRVVILSYDSVAVSNHPNPDVIRGVLEPFPQTGLAVWRALVAAQILWQGSAGEPVVRDFARAA